MPKPNPPGHAIPVHIQLSASLNQTTGKVEFAPISPILDTKEHEYIFNKRNQGMKANDYHEIYFTLIQDDTGLDLKLPTKMTDAFWVIDCTKVPHRCPDHTDSSDYSEFKPKRRANDKTLIVENYNEQCKFWMFSVNFVKQQSDGSYDENDRANYACYDPGGVNQDYSVRSDSLSVVSAGSIGLVAGALLTYAIERLL